MSKTIGIGGYTETNIPTDWVSVTPSATNLESENYVAIRADADTEITVEFRESGAARTLNLVAGEILPGHIKVISASTGSIHAAKG